MALRPKSCLLRVQPAIAGHDKAFRGLAMQMDFRIGSDGTK